MLLQGGVGGLAAGVAGHFWERDGAIACRPARATGSVDSVMAGLASGAVGDMPILSGDSGAAAPGVYQAITGQRPASVLQAQSFWMARPLHG